MHSPLELVGRRGPATAALLLATATWLGCPADPGKPEPPAILRDVAMTRVAADGTSAEWVHPHVPPLRTTYDGRVGLQVEASQARLFLLVPEKLDGPIVPGDAVDSIVAMAAPFGGGLDLGRGYGHQALCEVAPRFLPPGARPNPYPCGPGDEHECYDITHIGFTGQPAPGQLGKLWGTPLTIEVAEPKTTTAHIVDVTIGESVSTPIPGPVWFEPTVTSDGRLLTGRRLAPTDPLTYTWTNPNTGQSLTRTYDIMYAWAPDGAAPCDVRAWTAFHPISHAPFDPNLVGRYGVAAFPFRDPEGQPIPDGEDIGGTYPWLDREGDNLFLSMLDTRITEMPASVYPRRCAVDGCDAAFPEDLGSWTRGHAVAGLWTRGKLVHLDNLINNTDWGIGLPPGAHRMVTLYEDASGPVEVRVGGGRTNNWTGPIAQPPTFSGNASVFESIENLFNMHARLKPVTPADIVWVVSDGAATDELPFDDYLDPDAFIVSSMQGATRWSASSFRLLYQNGFRAGANQFLDDVHLQNSASATPDRWRVPRFGLVAAETGRLEHVALGGVAGKGFWLDGANRVSYAIEAQPRDVRAHDWWISVFLDSRAADEAARALLTFPDGSAILASPVQREIAYAKDGATLHTVDLGAVWPASGWVHLGWNVSEQGRHVVLHVNGFPFDVAALADPVFQLDPGELAVSAAGDGDTGVRGWIDELKVFAHTMSPEMACNHARGTLIDVGENTPWRDVAERYPAWAHQALAALLGSNGGGDVGDAFACYADYGADHAAHLANLPVGTTGLRRLVNFPEGPIRFGVPRPDSSSNTFCNSCHGPAEPHGLSTAALTPHPGVPAQDDHRRQPLQNPPRVHGHVPQDWIAAGPGLGGPSAPLTAPDDGLQIDAWVLP